jgi:hypothetical protein
MNNDRRKQINKAVALMQEALSILETARDEEQEYYDNMPEGLQGSERGEAAEQAVSNLEDACSNLEDAISSAESAAE